MRRLGLAVTIDASRERVWRTMLVAEETVAEFSRFGFNGGTR